MGQAKALVVFGAVGAVLAVRQQVEQHAHYVQKLLGGELYADLFHLVVGLRGVGEGRFQHQGGLTAAGGVHAEVQSRLFTVSVVGEAIFGFGVCRQRGRHGLGS